MKVCKRYFGEYFQNYISRYFRITESKIKDYSKNIFNKEEIEKIIDKYYNSMGLSFPYIHYLDSINELYLMLEKYEEENNKFYFSKNGIQFEANGIHVKIEHLKNKHHIYQTEIDSQAIEQSQGINITELINAINTYKYSKHLLKELKYFYYDENIDKAFMKVKEVSLNNNILFSINDRNTIIIDFFLRMTGLTLDNEIKEYLDDQDKLNKSVYNIFAFSNQCFVIKKQSDKRYISPYSVHKLSKREFMLELFRLVRENPLQINSYYYPEENVWRFPAGLTMCKIFYTNESKTNCAIIGESRREGISSKIIRNKRGKVYKEKPNWTDIEPYETYNVNDNEILKELYLELFQWSKIKYNLDDFDLSGYSLFNKKFAKENK
ncbi:MAG: hypothetical protein NTW25_11170 [Candidatus Kapabacteria bacterium]|nr:hypothetical protein [Candidatus Kapabacteria bacterium]